MGVARLYRVGSPYNGADLAEIDFEQSADTMYLAHIDHAPTKLVRRGHTDWEFSAIPFGPMITAPVSLSASVTGNPGASGYFPLYSRYAVTSVSDETAQESRASTPVSASNDLTLKGNYNYLSWGDVFAAGRYRVYRSDNQQGFGYIGTSVTAAFTDNDIIPDLTDSPPEGSNPFDTTGNWPSTVTFFEQRLIWARTRNNPNAVWGSKSGDFENMDVARPQKDDDALSFALVAGRVNAVNQLVSLTDLLALTSDSIFRINGGNQNGYLSPTQIVSRRQIGRGSSRLAPLVVDNVVFYKPSTGSAVRTIGYTFELDGYQSNDVSIFSPHLFAGFSIVSWAYAQEPRSVVWAVRDDGRLLCFTWEAEQQVWGWTLCETDGRVASVCVISEQREDRLYLTVWRTVGGIDRLYIEEMAASRWSDIALTCFLDCAVSYSFGSPSRVLGNLQHLEGRTLKALADGSVVSGLLVNNGQVTLPNATTHVTVGLPYDTLIETLPLAFQNQNGWNVGKRQQAGTAVLRLVNSRGVLTGPDEANLFEMKPRSDEAFAAPDALRSGDYEHNLAPHVTGETVMVVKSVDPLPLTITAILLDPKVAA